MAVPEAMASSDNEYAMQVNSMITDIAIGEYSSFFVVPAGATKIDQSISAANARTSVNTVTYEWTSQQGSIAYQITEQTDSYFYEVFIKSAGQEYYKYYEGEQAKDRKSGHFIVLNPSSDVRSVMIRYDYEIRSDNSLFIKYAFPEQNYNLEILFKADKSGYIKSLLGEDVKVEWNWDGAGNGSRIQYNEDGTEQKIEWTVS
ncbi:MAG: hypothetical protein WD555_05360 [Fulvivirga sp.]